MKTSQKIKAVDTPGVRRSNKEIDDTLDERPDSAYRSNVGSLIYYSGDVEPIAFAVKELARKLHAPKANDWMDLARCTKFLVGKEDFAVWSEVIGKVGEHRRGDTFIIDGYVDAGFCGDENGRSTTGGRIEINGFKIGHLSQTQPGLPALSSGEAELRALTRMICCCMYVQQLGKDIGMTLKIRMWCDATAAMSAASSLNNTRMRHLRLADQFCRNAVRMKLVALHKIAGENQKADITTKHVTAEVMKRFSSEWRDSSNLVRREVALKKCNNIEELEDARELVRKHRNSIRERDQNAGLELGKRLEADSASAG